MYEAGDLIQHISDTSKTVKVLDKTSRKYKLDRPYKKVMRVIWFDSRRANRTSVPVR